MSDYQKKKKTIQAVQLVKPVFDKHGEELAKKGDWLVIEGSRQYYMTNDEFNEEFELKSPDGAIHYYPVPYPYYIYVSPPIPPVYYPNHYHWVVSSGTSLTVSDTFNGNLLTSNTTNVNFSTPQQSSGVVSVNSGDENSEMNILSNASFQDCSYTSRV